jgi:hypothetical protein
VKADSLVSITNRNMDQQNGKHPLIADHENNLDADIYPIDRLGRNLYVFEINLFFISRKISR